MPSPTIYVPPVVELVVLVDKAEKRPLPFPPEYFWTFGRGARMTRRTFKVKTESMHLPYGDYLLKGFETVAGVERKGSVSELAMNHLTKDRGRYERALGKLIKGVRYPYLLLEMPAGSFMTDPYVADTNEVMNNVAMTTAWKGLRVMAWHVGNTTAARMNVGLQVVRWLWAHAWESLLRRQHPEQKPNLT